MKGRLDIGQKLLKLEGSAPGFFRIGVMAAVLKDVGTVPVVREEWMSAKMRGIREGREDLNRCVGRGQVDRWMAWISE